MICPSINRPTHPTHVSRCPVGAGIGALRLALAASFLSFLLTAKFGLADWRTGGHFDFGAHGAPDLYAPRQLRGIIHMLKAVLSRPWIWSWVAAAATFVMIMLMTHGARVSINVNRCGRNWPHVNCRRLFKRTRGLGASLFMFLVVSMLNSYGLGAGVRMMLTGIIIIGIVIAASTRKTRA